MATEYVTVKMDDGRTMDFPGKRRLQKEGFEGSNGELMVRFDFVNGETRTFTIPDSLAPQFALHGAGQKIGDEAAGLDDVEDMIEAIDTLIERLNAGEWVQRRENSGIAGSSILARALVELTGKSPVEVKAGLKVMGQAEKVALRDHPKLSPIIAKLEANKKKKPSGVDTDALMAKFA